MNIISIFLVPQQRVCCGYYFIKMFLRNSKEFYFADKIRRNAIYSANRIITFLVISSAKNKTYLSKSLLFQIKTKKHNK